MGTADWCHTVLIAKIQVKKFNCNTVMRFPNVEVISIRINDYFFNVSKDDDDDDDFIFSTIFWSTLAMRGAFYFTMK